MPFLVTFQTDVFPLEREPENPYNPCYGYSVGVWLTPLLEESGAKVGNVEAEDWGWYMDVRIDGYTYLLGFTIHGEPAKATPDEVIIQIWKKRSIWERLRKKNLMDSNDPLLKLIDHEIKTLPIVGEVSISNK